MNATNVVYDFPLAAIIMSHAHFFIQCGKKINPSSDTSGLVSASDDQGCNNRVCS